MLSSGGGEDHGGGGRGRNHKYDNGEYNNEDRIHVRRNVVNVGSVGKRLGTTGSDQTQQLTGDKDTDKDKDEDGCPSPPPS